MRASVTGPRRGALISCVLCGSWRWGGGGRWRQQIPAQGELAPDVYCLQTGRGITKANVYLVRSGPAWVLNDTALPRRGQIIDLTRPRMGALWYLDLTPGVDTVFDEISASYRGAVTATQDLTVFNVTPDAVTAPARRRSTMPHHRCTDLHRPAPDSIRNRPLRHGGPKHSSTSDLHPLTGRAGRRSAAPTARVAAHRSPRSGAAQAAALATGFPSISADPVRRAHRRLVTEGDRPT